MTTTLSKDDPKLALLENGSAAASSTSALSSALTCTNCIQAAIEVLLTYGASTAAARLDVYGSMDNVTYTTAPIASYDVLLAANTTSRQEFGVVNFPPYLKFQIANLDASVAISVIYIYAVRQLVT